MDRIEKWLLIVTVILGVAVCTFLGRYLYALAQELAK